MELICRGFKKKTMIQQDFLALRGRSKNNRKNKLISNNRKLLKKDKYFIFAEIIKGNFEKRKFLWKNGNIVFLPRWTFISLWVLHC